MRKVLSLRVQSFLLPRRRIRKVLAGLSPRDREIVYLRAQGHSFTIIGQDMGLEPIAAAEVFAEFVRRVKG
jgi:hypothetical protein